MPSDDDFGKENVELEPGWKEIREKALVVLVKMMDERKDFTSNKKLFNNNEYMEVYTVTYNMCTQVPDNWSAELYQRHGNWLDEYLTEHVLPFLTRLENVQGSCALLDELVRRGDNHTVMNKWMVKFFMYLDRFHIEYNNLPTLTETGLEKFKLMVFDPVKVSVTSLILDLVNKERGGDAIDRPVISNTIKLFERMGMDTLDVYNNDFEKPFLDGTRVYYKAKSGTWSESMSTPDYLINSEKAITEESNRVKAYLNPESEEKVLAVITDELLAKTQQDLLNKENSGCLVLLRNEQNEHLERMYRLFNRITDGIKPMADLFKQHIVELGTKKVEARQHRISNAKDKETNDDPEFIKDLIAIHDRYLDIITRLFNNNNLFQKALKDAFSDIVNRDIGKFKTADLMSSFCDRILKGREKLSDTEADFLLDQTVQIFTYLNDKDVFAEIYRNQLSKRLLSQKSVSDEMEKTMIGKLKMKCGTQFTAKIEGMVSDLNLGKETGSKFEEVFKGKRAELGMPTLAFSVQQLTSGYWPAHTIYNVNLPPLMQKAQKAYEDFFKKTFDGRRLQWFHVLGNATVKGTFQEGKKSFDFKITTLQAILLLEFNSLSIGDNISFSTLGERTALPEEVLKRVMHSLSCAKEKVLKKISQDPSASDKVIRDTDSFSCNDAYSSQKRQVLIPMASLDEVSAPKRMENDRSHALDACIVRIMKARKTLGHEQLVVEVLSQLSFFRPERKFIKKRIEGLIEREFLERDGPTTYNYMA